MALTQPQFDSILYNIAHNHLSIGEALDKIGMEHWQYNNRVSGEQREKIHLAKAAAKNKAENFQPKIKQPKARIQSKSLSLLVNAYNCAKEVEKLAMRNLVATSRTATELKMQIVEAAKLEGVELEDIKMEKCDN